MTHADAHGHGSTTHAGDRPYFPEAEWQQFQKEDIAAGKGIIILITSIFTIGLVLYSVVALVVNAG